MTDSGPVREKNEGVALIAPHLVEIETLQLAVRLGRDCGIDPVMVADVMFQTVLEQIVLCLGPEATVRYLQGCVDLVQRAARAADTHGLSEMQAQGEA